MPQFSTTRRVRHSAADMFDLVADVERYPEFVPLCRALKVRQRIPEPEGVEILVADMTVAYKLIRETFTSRVTLDRPNLQILVEYLEGPFSQLENRWTFHADRRARPARSSSSSPTSSGAARWAAHGRDVRRCLPPLRRGLRAARRRGLCRVSGA